MCTLEVLFCVQHACTGRILVVYQNGGAFGAASCCGLCFTASDSVILMMCMQNGQQHKSFSSAAGSRNGEIDNVWNPFFIDEKFF